MEGSSAVKSQSRAVLSLLPVTSHRLSGLMANAETLLSCPAKTRAVSAAQLLREELLARARRLNGESHLETAACYDRLANVFDRQKKYDQAEGVVSPENLFPDLKSSV